MPETASEEAQNENSKTRKAKETKRRMKGKIYEKVNRFG